MKKILLSVLTAFCLTASAGTVPADFTVLTRFVTGAPTTLCRSVMAAYTREHKGTVNVVAKPGADGVLAVEEVMSADKFTVLCATATELVFNQFEYPQYAKIHNDLQITNILSNTIVSFSTGPNSRYQNLTELIGDKKSITVGLASTAHTFIAKKIFREGQIVLVPFKSPNQAVPSLLDGSLDVYISGGAFEELHREGKLKSLGHMHGTAAAVGPALDKIYPEIVKYNPIIGLAVPKSTSPEVMQEFSRRIAAVMRSPEVQKTLQDINNTYPQNNMQQANAFVEHMRSEVRKSR